MENISQEAVNVNTQGDIIGLFFKRFEIGRKLSGLSFRKIAGARPVEIIQVLIQLVFTRKNWWRLGRDDEAPYKKDVIYRFLKSPRFDWEGLLCAVSVALIKTISRLTRKRVKALIGDDTFRDRDRSKKVEGLSRVHDHTDGKYKKGFTQLMVGWSDGFSFIPLFFVLLVGSAKNLLCALKELGDKRPSSQKGGIKRRREAGSKKTDLLVEMVKKAKKLKISFQYVLVDSWFSFPSLIGRLRDAGTDVICMLKRMPKVFYLYDGGKHNLKALRKIIGKRLKSAPIAINVKMSDGRAARIVFVRHRSNPGEWLALLSTNVKLDAKEIIRIYGYRWDIEVCFKMCKSYLNLNREFEGRSYDMMAGHTCIVLLRYCLLALALREENDIRSMGDLFYHLGDEIRDKGYFESLRLVLSLLKEHLSKKFEIEKKLVEDAIDEFIKNLVFSPLKMGLKRCES